jgi:hypothetical protein
MSTIKVDTVKPVTASADLSLQGDSSGSAVDCLNIDSSGDINFTGNTDAKIKLPSAGGIYESDGSTAVLTESGGAVTIANATFNGTIGASATVQTGSIVQCFKAEADSTGQTSTSAIQYNAVLGTTTGTSALKSSSNDVLVFVQANVVKRNATTSSYVTAYAVGGGLGAGTSGVMVGNYLGYGGGDNSWGGTIMGTAIDTSPGSTTPTYSFYANFSSAVNFQFYNITLTFLEIKG